jgi:hypothetical protein
MDQFGLPAKVVAAVWAPASAYRIYLLFVLQICVKHPDDGQIAVYAGRLHAFIVKVVDIGIYLFIGYLLDSNIKPDDKLLEDVQIIFDRMRRVIASL